MVLSIVPAIRMQAGRVQVLKYGLGVTHHWCLTEDPSVYVACEGLSDLGNGPNKPTATIIGECSTSCHDGALLYSG